LAESIERAEPNDGFFSASYMPDADGDPKKDMSIDGETLRLGIKRIQS
jgi:hypothetical protein